MWHRIDIFTSRKHVRMVVGHCMDSVFFGGVEDRSGCEASGYTRGEAIYLNVATMLQLGGRISEPSYPGNVVRERFIGCIRNLIHNTEIYDLSTGGLFPGSKDGCPLEDAACGSEGCGRGQCQVTDVVAGELKAACVCDQSWRKSNSDKCDTKVPERSLMAESFIAWHLKDAFVTSLNVLQTTVSFHVRTRDSDGLILSLSGQSNENSFITFMLTGGHLQLVYNMGDGEVALILSEIRVDNGQYHLVTLERYGSMFILKLDGGEGRYYTETSGRDSGLRDFSIRQDRIVAGASVSYASGSPVYYGDDLSNTCIKDVRLDNSWFPITFEEAILSPAAVLVFSANVQEQCSRDDCPPGQCTPPKICVPKWEDFTCSCPEHYVNMAQGCEEIDYCSSGSLCFGGICSTNVHAVKEEDIIQCACCGEWYGNLCQCNPYLDIENSATCRTSAGEIETADIGTVVGAVIGSIVGIFASIAMVIFVYRYRPSGMMVLLQLLRPGTGNPKSSTNENETPYDTIDENVESLGLSPVQTGNANAESVDVALAETDDRSAQSGITIAESVDLALDETVDKSRHTTGVQSGNEASGNTNAESVDTALEQTVVTSTQSGNTHEESVDTALAETDDTSQPSSRIQPGNTNAESAYTTIDETEDRTVQSGNTNVESAYTTIDETDDMTVQSGAQEHYTSLNNRNGPDRTYSTLSHTGAQEHYASLNNRNGPDRTYSTLYTTENGAENPISTMDSANDTNLQLEANSRL